MKIIFKAIGLMLAAYGALVLLDEVLTAFADNGRDVQELHSVAE